MGAPPNVLPLPGVGMTNQNAMQNQYAGFDTTGQQPPPGMKPRVTATLWEDEDNHMINGTKLLNVAGMTRGRRDGILKSEKVRHVVKIGPMHLKGVWIPYDRALDFANKEKITEMLYPLFVHNIGALLYHPTNPGRATQVMAAVDRQKRDGPMRHPPPSGLPSMQQQHHSLTLPTQPSLPSQANTSRPSIDRSLTFPTPPASASSVMGGMGSSEGFNWQGQGMNGAQATNSMGMDNGLGGARSMPNTPATTPPGSSLQSLPYSSGAQGYDSQRQMYNAPPTQQSPYQTSTPAGQDRMYAQPNGYPKTEMAPPASRSSATLSSSEQQDSKPQNGILASGSPNQNRPAEDDGDQEHEQEYTHDSSNYDHSRAAYNYSTQGVGSMASDSNVSPDMAGSQAHPPASGRATPRTAALPQPYYQTHAGYNTPPRTQQSSSNLYNVMMNDRAPPNGAANSDVYSSSDMTSPMTNGYTTQTTVMNGSTTGIKRGRDDDDDLSRPVNDDPTMGNHELKRRKTMIEATVPAPPYDAMNRPSTAIATGRRR
ncbi:Cell pattern formation-associated protein stuA [Escovopsis weberi]|uniref:Cell pattern formation-associated protein stuA n=1 Tax=Escovopsis weberi TaxID=150374 RepID=A0A0M8N5D7_ESCWE|nr:Cell pattern formation-associated protein stuA [Escovopsis weberi]